MVVSLVSPETVGEWEINEEGNNVVAGLRAADGSVFWFALTGDGVKEKVRLQKELPSILA